MKRLSGRKPCGLLAACLLLLTASFASPQQSGSGARPGERVQCASLVYAGSKTSQCFSAGFLQRIGRETRIKTEPRLRSLRLDSRDLARYPFAVMSGEGGFRLTEKERQQLRYYVTHGGFLLASAGCSDADWGRSFRAEFARMFPGRRLERIPRDHLLFRILYRIDSLATIHGHSGPNGVPLEGLTHKGRLVLLFSPNGLNDTAHAENCCCCGGDEIDRAEFINVNALAYALLR